MRRAYRRVWKVVPCTSKTMLRTESSKDIEEILKTKLATINEEEEPVDKTVCQEKYWAARLQLRVAKSVKKISSNKANKKKGRCFVPKVSLKESYALFMAAGFASKGIAALVD